MYSSRSIVEGTMGNAAQQNRGYWLGVEGKGRLHLAPSNRRLAPLAVAIRSHKSTTSSEVAALGLILALLQIADGLLTALGMSHYGTNMEGNLLLRELMHLVGFIPALVMVKTVAIGVVTGLCLHAYSVSWLKPAFKIVIGLYITFAVLPWSVILATEYFA